MPKNLSEFLVSRGLNEEELGKTEEGQRELAKMSNFFRHHRERKAEVACLDCKDKAGQDVKVGDTVTITYKVTAVHGVLDHDTGDFKPGVAEVSLSRVIDGDKVRHAFGCPSTWVEKG